MCPPEGDDGPAQVHAAGLAGGKRARLGVTAHKAALHPAVPHQFRQRRCRLAPAIVPVAAWNAP